MRSKILVILLHIIGWSLFFSLPFIFMPSKFPDVPPIKLPSGEIFPSFNSMPRKMMRLHPFQSKGMVLLNAMLFIYFYLNAYWLMPKLFSLKKYWLYALISISLLMICLFIPERVNYLFHDDKIFEIRKRSPDLIAMFLFLVVFLVSSCIYITRQWLNAEKLNTERENDQLATELAFLRSQINPHFLFNTLNNIYSLAVTKSEHTADAILKLSDMMRYVVTDAAMDVVPLSKEIGYLRHFVELQKIRLTDNAIVTMNIHGDIQQQQIAPLLLISFIENAFKHGVSTMHPSVIDIEISVSQTKLELVVKNKIHHGQPADMHSSGTGLANARRRLNLLYNNKHTLDIDHSAENFCVHLLVDLI